MVEVGGNWPVVPVTVWYETADGTAKVAGNDYVAARGSVVIMPGFNSGDPSRAAIPLTIVGDTTYERKPDGTDEWFKLRIVRVEADAGALTTVLADTARIYISDDDTPP